MKAFIAALAVCFALPALAAVDIKEVTSPGGITAWLVEEHSIPFMSIEIRFRGGASLDAPGKRGAINLMTGLLEEGTGDLDARAFAQRSEELAADFGFDVYNDSLAISASVLTENRTEALDLLRTALVEPSFSQPDIDRVKGQVASILRSDSTDPNSIANEAFDTLAFGDHPYATSLNGTLNSVAALTRDDLVEAKNRVMARDRVYVAAVGDITAEELGPLLDHLLGGLPETGAEMPGRAPTDLTGGVMVVDFDTPQSVVMFGHEGIERFDDDFFPAYVMNQILGDHGFSSRLMREVREKRGLTYGIGTYLVPMDHAELYLGQFATANEKAAEAIEVVRQVWADTAANGVTAEELEQAKTYLTGEYALRWDGNATIAAILVGMQTEGLPIDYAETRNDRIEAVTLEDIKRVAARILRPDDLRFVVVGRPVGLVGERP
jgi:zinc protease